MSAEALNVLPNPQLPRVNSKILEVKESILKQAFTENLRAAATLVADEEDKLTVDPLIMRAFLSQVDEIAAEYESNPIPRYQECIASLMQLMMDYNPHPHHGAALPIANEQVYRYFNPEYLEPADVEIEEDPAKLSKQYLGQRRLLLEKGARMWEAAGFDQFPRPQRVMLFDRVIRYIDLLRTEGGINITTKGFSTFEWGVQTRTFEMSYEEYTITIPCDWPSLHKLIDLVVSGCLIPELQRAREKNITNFQQLTIGYLDQDDIKKIQAAQGEPDDLLTRIQMGAAKWSPKHGIGELTVRQKVLLLLDIQKYLDLNLTPQQVVMPDFIYSNFSVTRLALNYNGYSIDVPTDWNSLGKFVRLVANECLTLEMQRAKDNNYNDFELFVVHLHVRQKYATDLWEPYQTVLKQVHVFTKPDVVVTNPIFESNTPDRESMVEDDDSAETASVVSEIGLGNITPENADFLAAQIKMFVEWCGFSTTGASYLRALLKQIQFKEDFLVKYFPNDYLTSQERIKYAADPLKKGVEKYGSKKLNSQQICRLLFELCITAQEQLNASDVFSLIEFSPSINEVQTPADLGYFGWNIPIIIRAEREINGQTEARETQFANSEAFKTFAERVVHKDANKNLVSFIRASFGTNSQPGSRSVTPRALTPGSRSSSRSGDPLQEIDSISITSAFSAAPQPKQPTQQPTN